ncbi:hypothetical protein B0H15DRAFT_428600 [Mycena belliarum]|uniref:DUF6697 domain-containing protein n=1 Tax=Mycena belliarum TaxID=1033014 RepID=A0AAD6TZT1_9AGAR|nr:hypothetical protein B0H15DRAFT_428600 [Mycena belliae]
MDIDIRESEPDTDNEPPAKRCRLIMDAVEVPSIASVRIRAEVERQEIHRKLELLRNPIVKKPKDTPTLSLDSVRERLRSIGYEVYPIDLENTILDVTVRRDFMSKEYGGNPQDTYPKIGSAFVARTGKSRFSYLNLLYNPHCPEIPGAPGLLFDVKCSGEPNDSGGDQVKEEEGKPHGAGGNEDEPRGPAPPLTLDEWKQQSSAVRKNWAKQIAKKRWGLSIRADITLRRQLGRKPTDAEKKAALKSKNAFKTVTPEEISSALDRREVIVVVSTLKCVGYKADFQRDLAAKIPFFVPPPRKAAGKGKKGKNTNHRKAAPVVKGQKRKRMEPESDSDDEDSDSTSEEEEEIVYRPRGTRSRPIVNTPVASTVRTTGVKFSPHHFPAATASTFDSILSSRYTSIPCCAARAKSVAWKGI